MEPTDFIVALTTDRCGSVCVCAGSQLEPDNFTSRTVAVLRNIDLLSDAEDQQVPESIYECMHPSEDRLVHTDRRLLNEQLFGQQH